MLGKNISHQKLNITTYLFWVVMFSFWTSAMAQDSNADLFDLLVSANTELILSKIKQYEHLEPEDIDTIYQQLDENYTLDSYTILTGLRKLKKYTVNCKKETYETVLFYYDCINAIENYTDREKTFDEKEALYLRCFEYKNLTPNITRMDLLSIVYQLLGSLSEKEGKRGKSQYYNAKSQELKGLDFCYELYKKVRSEIKNNKLDVEELILHGISLFQQKNDIMWRDRMYILAVKYYCKVGQAKKANIYLNKIGEPFKQAFTSQYYSAASTYYLYIKDDLLAEEALRRRQEYAQKDTTNYNNSITECLALANYYKEKNRPDDALIYYQMAATQSLRGKDDKEIENYSQYIRILLGLSSVYFMTNQLEDAKHKLSEVELLIQEKFKSTKHYIDKVAYLEFMTTLNEIYFKNQEALGLDNNRLLEISEQDKSYVLLSELKNIKSIKELNKATLYSEILEAKNQKLIAKKRMNIAFSEKKNHFANKACFTKYTTALETLDSLYGLLQLPNEFTTDINFSDLKTSVLSYFTTDQYIYQFLINDGLVQLQKIELDANLNNSISYFIEQIRDRDSNIDSLSKHSHRIYQCLLHPVAPQLKENIVIIPHGYLSNIAFEAIKNNENRYLVEQYNISYSYSIGVLQQMKTEPPSSYSYLGIAPSNKHYEILASNAKEIESCAVNFSKQVLLKDTAATKANFLNTFAAHNIIQISSHAEMNPYDGDNSYIVFSDGHEGEAYKLYMNSLQAMDLNTEMIVLSACETGIGQYKKGEGILSLARGFVHAGTASVISSLWKVDDQATYKIMKGFFAEISKGKNKDNALAEAKNKYLISSRKASRKHPYYWAGLIAIGDMKPIKVNNCNYLLLGGIFVLFFSIIFFLYRSRFRAT